MIKPDAAMLVALACSGEINRRIEAAKAGQVRKPSFPGEQAGINRSAAIPSAT